MKLEKEKTDYQDFLSTEDCVLDALQKLTDFAQEHGLVVLSIEDIVYYRKFVRDYR